MSASALAPGLARKVKKILDIKTESPDVISALNTLSTFYDDNTPAARRQLRSTIEKRGLEINQEFLTAAESVIQVCVFAFGAVRCVPGGGGGAGAPPRRCRRSPTHSQTALTHTHTQQKNYT